MTSPVFVLSPQAILQAAVECQSKAWETVLVAAEARARAEHTLAQVRRNRALAEQVQKELRAARTRRPV